MCEATCLHTATMSSDDESVKVEEGEEVHDDLTNPDIVSKYRLAADIANRA